MVTCRTHALCSRVTSLIGSCAFSFGDRVSLCRVGSANGNHSGFQLVTCSRKPTFRNGYIWVTIPQVTRKQCIKNNSYGYCGLRWYIILNTKIVPKNINDPRKHLQHRDQRGSTSNLWMLHHGKQVENLMRLLGKLSGIQGAASFWERTEAPLPPPRPGCNFIHPKQLSPFPERLELPFPSEETLSGYEDVVSSRQDQYTTWVKTDPDDLRTTCGRCSKGRRRISRGICKKTRYIFSGVSLRQQRALSLACAKTTQHLQLESSTSTWKRRCL